MNFCFLFLWSTQRKSAREGFGGGEGYLKGTFGIPSLQNSKDENRKDEEKTDKTKKPMFS